MYLLTHDRIHNAQTFAQYAANQIVGKRLCPSSGLTNRGRFGHCVESVLGLPKSMEKSADVVLMNGDTVEVKSTALSWKPTLQGYSLHKQKITQTTESELLSHSFEQHSLSMKLAQWLLVGHMPEASKRVSVGKAVFLLSPKTAAPRLFDEFEEDYRHLQQRVAFQSWQSLSSTVGRHFFLGTAGETKKTQTNATRAFYLRPHTVRLLIEESALFSCTDDGFRWSRERDFL